MGIFVNAISIVSGSFFGDIFGGRIKLKNLTVLSISIMIISLVGFLENVFDVSGIALKSNELLVIVFSLIIGTTLGDALQLETRLSNLSSYSKGEVSVFIDSAVFFGIGGLQICGPLMLAISGDNSQLILKSMIDFPFAIMFGISYGKKTAFSAIPVAIIQILIAALAMVFGQFLDASVIRQLCAMGYIILFFSGLNLMNKTKINNVNMILGIFMILLYHIILQLLRCM